MNESPFQVLSIISISRTSRDCMSTNCMTWESRESNEMHTLSATSSSRHNSEQQLKSKLKKHMIVSAIVLPSPVNKPALCYIIYQVSFHTFLQPCMTSSQMGSSPAPTLCLYRLQRGWHGMHLQQLHSHTSLSWGVCLNLLIWAVCVLLLHGGKCFD